MTAPADTIDEDRALKAKHRAMWSLGDYPTVALDLIPDLGAVLVDACGIGPGDRVLDVAAGPGNAAIAAAKVGAAVVASDLTPELLSAGRRYAERTGVALEWREADAEALPFPDHSFDAVVSCVGIMFAPHHQASADELVRVCRPGGAIGLLSWTPEGFIGQMLATMKPYVAPPPAGVQPPTLWGAEDHVRSLLGDRIIDVEVRRQAVTIDRFRDPDEFRDYFKGSYGPTIAAYRGIADDPERTVALDAELSELARRHGLGDESARFDWEYLLFTARTVE